MSITVKTKQGLESLNQAGIERVRQEVAVEAAGVGTFEWDIPTSAFISSPRFAEIFGHTPDTSFTHDELATMVHPDDDPIRLKAHEQAAKTGKLFYEVRFILPDKTVRWTRISGKVIFDPQGQA